MNPIKSPIFLSVIFFTVIFTSCKNNSNNRRDTNHFPYEKVDGVAVDMENKGVGPIRSISLPEGIDADLVDQGKKLYQKYCSACHKPTQRFVGPAPKGILDRRSPEWIMNMILAPDKMIKEDPVAKQLLMEYNGSPMANQGLSEEEARAILEYFRTL